MVTVVLNVDDKIKDTLSNISGVDSSRISRDSKLVEDLCIDSLDVLDLLATLEEDFSIKGLLPDGLKLIYGESFSYNNLTVGPIIDYVKKSLGVENA